MKKLLLTIVMLMSLFLISCEENTITQTESSSSTTSVVYDPLVAVNFSYELSDFTQSAEEQVTKELVTVHGMFEVVNLRKLTSDFGEVPYEKEFLDNPERVADIMRAIFEDLDDGEAYESQLLYMMLGPMAQTTVYLEQDDFELICEFYYYEETNETAFRVYLRESDSLVFYHDFENRFQEEYGQIVELLN